MQDPSELLLDILSRGEADTDPAPFAVYGDWLSQRGDSRGALVAHMLELEKHGGSMLALSPQSAAKRRQSYEHRYAVTAARSGPDQERMLRRIRAEEQVEDLLAAHRKEWLGDLAKNRAFHCWWWRGLIRSVQLGGDPSSSRPVELDVADTYARLLELPAAMAVREITFGAWGPREELETSARRASREPRIGEPSWQIATDALVERGVPAALESLSYDRGHFWRSAGTSSGLLEPLYRAVPSLRRLYLRLGHFDFGEITLPALRDFEVVTGGLTRENMKAIANAHWPNLERLILTFGDPIGAGGESDCELTDLDDLVDAPPPRLRELGIANAHFVDDIVPLLAGTGLLARLDALDLSRGHLSDMGAEQIVEHAEAVRHLRRLDVSRSFLSDEAVERLRDALPQTIADAQRSEGC